MYAISLFAFRILDSIPLARQTTIQELHAGTLVLDSQERIVSLNLDAQRIFDLPAKRLVGQLAEQLLSAYSVRYVEPIKPQRTLVRATDQAACTWKTTSMSRNSSATMCM